MFLFGINELIFCSVPCSRYAGLNEAIGRLTYLVRLSNEVLVGNRPMMSLAMLEEGNSAPKPPVSLSRGRHVWVRPLGFGLVGAERLVFSCAETPLAAKGTYSCIWVFACVSPSKGVFVVCTKKHHNHLHFADVAHLVGISDFSKLPQVLLVSCQPSSERPKS